MPAVAELIGRDTGHIPSGALAALVEDGDSAPDFIGKIFAKSSPILTWRPTKVQRITPTPLADPMSESGAHSFSRAPTRRMVSWPLVREVQSSKRRALRALLTLVAFSLLCGSALTLCVYVLLGDGGTTAWQQKPAPTRVGIAHVAAEHLDTLLATAAPAAPVDPAPAPVLARHAAKAPVRARVLPHGNGHRYQPGALHAGRAPHSGSMANHGTT
jgi:hypothetical protein